MRYELWLGVRYLFAKRRERFISIIAALVMTMVVGPPIVRTWADASQPGEPVNGLRAVLSGPSQSIHLRGGFHLTLELQNVSQQPVSLYRYVSQVLATPGYVQLRLRAADGTTVAPMQPIDEHEPPTPKDYQRVHPGERMVFDFPINYRLPEAIQVPELSVGRYEVFLEVVFSEEGWAAGVRDAWAGTILSNVVIVEVQ